MCPRPSSRGIPSQVTCLSLCMALRKYGALKPDIVLWSAAHTLKKKSCDWRCPLLSGWLHTCNSRQAEGGAHACNGAGPGLAVRVLGDVTEGEALDVLRQVDEIYINTIRDFGLYDKIWQAFAVFLPVRCPSTSPPCAAMLLWMTDEKSRQLAAQPYPSGNFNEQAYKQESYSCNNF